MRLPAISGGPAVVPPGAVKTWPIITEEDISAVVQALRSGRLWGRRSPNVIRLEEALCHYFGARHCLLTQSGTAALHLALTALGIGPGDEVITTAYSFIATPMAILHANAIPVFADIDPVTCNISVQDAERRITPATKAILPVHMHGLPADMDGINALARKHGLAVIEDACQAHGAEYKGRKAGSLGDVGCFSLNGAKNLTAGGEGGFLLTDDTDLYERAIAAATFGKGKRDGTEHSNPALVFHPGWMYRIQELPAAIALSQLPRLDEYNALRIANAEYLSKGLSGTRGIKVQLVPPDRTHVYYTYRLRFDPAALGIDIAVREFREAIEKALFAEGVPAGQADKHPLHLHPVFRDRIGHGRGCPWNCRQDADGPATPVEVAFEHVGRLFDDHTVIRGVHPPNGTALMDLYLEAVHKVFDHLEEVLEKAGSFDPPSNNCEMFGGYF